MASEAKYPAFIASFISRAVPSATPEKLKTPGDTVDLATLCKNLVNAAGPVASDVLYGEDVRSNVNTWLNFASEAHAGSDSLSSSSRLGTLNTYLASKAVFLGNGTTIGIADIAVFVSIHDELAALSAEERISYPNLLRWIDFVQVKYDQSRAYEWITVVKPDFDPPVPSTELDTKKAPSAAHGASAKDRSGSGAAVGAPDQQKQGTKVQEGNGKAGPLKGAGPADGAKGIPKEKKSKAEGLSSGKGGTEDDAKKGQQKGKTEPAPPPQKDAFGLEILDIRVGVIKSVKKHPTAETLYVEEVDVGEGSVRQVVSGLAKFLTEDQMLNRRVLVLANVKPSKLRDVMSAGLVLCTSNDDHSQCEPVIPPADAKVGERVTAEGYEGKPEAVLNPKKKQWDKIYPDLQTDDAGVACYKGKPLTTSAGPCTSSITKGAIK